MKGNICNKRNTYKRCHQSITTKASDIFAKKAKGGESTFYLSAASANVSFCHVQKGTLLTKNKKCRSFTEFTNYRVDFKIQKVL